MKKWILIPVFVLILTGIYSFKMLDIPPGLTLDEAAFGYNAALLAKTGRDENGRFMPVFVLSSSGTDWRQPITQYYLTVLFKLFGPSLFLLRFSSVMIIVGSALALYFVVVNILGKVGALAAAGVLALTPIVVIQSHLALDNIIPIPLTIVWLWATFEYLKTKNLKWAALMGAILGLSLYSYKGMRAITPIWLLISAGSLALDGKWKLVARRWFYLGLSASPFFLIIPWIEKHYPGAMMGGAKAVFNNVYEFLYPYLSSFDVSNWFISGDLFPLHSTGIHGMYLLATAPWFFVGVYLAIKSRKPFYQVLLAAFFLGPLLFGSVGSVHRFSRLLMMVPIYSIMVGLAVSEIWNKKRGKMWVMAGLLLAIINIGDFLNYYWKTYPGIAESYTGVYSYRYDLRELASISDQKKIEPVLSKQAAQSTGESGKFFQMVYFGRLLRTIDDGKPPSKGEVLLSPEEAIKGASLVSRPAQFRIYLSE